jgi:hypothetical protein
MLAEVRDEVVGPATHEQPALVLVEEDVVGVAGRQLAPGAQERAVELAQGRVLDPAELGRLERGGISSPANAAKAANSRRRPSRVAVAMRLSM